MVESGRSEAAELVPSSPTPKISGLCAGPFLSSMPPFFPAPCSNRGFFWSPPLTNSYVALYFAFRSGGSPGWNCSLRCCAS